MTAGNTAPNVVASTPEDRDAAIRMWHKHCDPFKSWMGETPPSPVIDAMLAFAARPPSPAEGDELSDRDLHGMWLCHSMMNRPERGNARSTACAIEFARAVIAKDRAARSNVQPKGTVGEEHRAAFEASWNRRNHPVPINSRRHADGRYADHRIEREWTEWKERHGVATVQAPAPGAPTGQPIGYMSPKVLGSDGKLASDSVAKVSGAAVGGWTLPVYVTLPVQAPAEGDEPETYTVDAVAWESFLSEYERYAAGDPKLPFSAIREGLSAVISSAEPNVQPKGSDKANEWRKLAQQLDGQRMAAMVHLRTLLAMPTAHAEAARAFLAATPAEQIASVAPVQAPAPAPEAPASTMLVDRIKKAALLAKMAADNIVSHSAAGKGMTGWLDDACTYADSASKDLNALLAAFPAAQAPAVGAEPIGYLNPKVLGPDGKIAATGALTHSGVPVGGWTLPIYTAPQPKAAQAALTDEQRLGREARLRAAGMSGLLSEILGKGALSQYGDADLIERVEMAVADQEAASKPPVQGKEQP